MKLQSNVKIKTEKKLYAHWKTPKEALDFWEIRYFPPKAIYRFDHGCS
jgi:hypothetical protein